MVKTIPVNEKERLLEFKDVTARIAISRSLLFYLIARKEFPAPVSVTKKAKRFLESEVDRWIAERANARIGGF